MNVGTNGALKKWPGAEKFDSCVANQLQAGEGKQLNGCSWHLQPFWRINTTTSNVLFLYIFGQALCPTSTLGGCMQA